jgi:hypothetical protein
MRTRLRPAYGADDLSRIYSTPHCHSRWADHRIRVAVTTEIARWVATEQDCRTAADLSCGDAAITKVLGLPTTLGDYAPGYPITGPIEDTIHQIDPVDLFVCSETLEHLDDPDTVLKRIRSKTRCLVLSTPDGETGLDNPEHYWGWDAAAVEDMLRAAGFAPVVCNVLRLDTQYDYQIWGCR